MWHHHHFGDSYTDEWVVAERGLVAGAVMAHNHPITEPVHEHGGYYYLHLLPCVDASCRWAGLCEDDDG